MTEQTSFKIGNREIGTNQPPYFIADIAANHDGNLERAVELIHLAAESGADAAKFQHFSADTLVSDFGFRQLGQQLSHQSKWKKSVFEVYQDASISTEWTETLYSECQRAGITFLSTPYSLELADHIDPYVDAYKIGSGDINFPEIIAHVTSSGKPWLIATGASDLNDVDKAVAAAGSNRRGVIMQCNTNYTADSDNFKFINLNVLKEYAARYPDLVLGLSDHTLGHSTVLGAMALGARVFEKHFTDDTRKSGPDHGFSMTPSSWREMVQRSMELFLALGDGEKKVEENERDTVVLQRRSLRATRDISSGETITKGMLEALRPAPLGSIAPSALESVLGRTLLVGVSQGEHLSWQNLT
jgi:sialic acid synthase SpsE